MSKSNIDDFKIGDEVYHLSNMSISMVIVQIQKGINEITCRWIDSKGQIQKFDFIPEELEKPRGGYDAIFLG